MKKEILKQIDDSIETKRKIKEYCMNNIEKTINLICEAYENNKKLLICGNGGSAADSQHLAAEFISSFRSSFKRRSLPAIALTTDSSILTAYSNDFGFDGVFARQVEGLGNEGDILIGLSTSGNSKSVIEAFIEAKEKNMKIVALLGRDGGKLKDMADISIIVPAEETSRIQEGHILIYHIICDLVEKKLFKQNS